MIQENNLISGRDILARLAGQKNLYCPLEIVSVAPVRTASDQGFDARITLGWRRRRVNFLAEVKTRTAPKLIGESLWRLKNYPNKRRQNLLLIVPFLSKTIVEMLERQGLSGLDLNGNYLIETPEMAAVRLDRENQFPESRPIRKIFSGNSSLVGRLFLAAPKRFNSVGEVFSEIQALGGSLSLSAVSKVLKGLEDELLIEKKEKRLSLLQPDKLLQSLLDGYQPPRIEAVIRLKLPASGLAAVRKLGALMPASSRWALDGESSAQRYAVTTPAETFTVYASDLGSLGRYEDERFFNITAKKTLDAFPCFDVQRNEGVPWSSPVQCCLELSRLDKREREIAAAVREAILRKFR